MYFDMVTVYLYPIGFCLIPVAHCFNCLNNFLVTGTPAKIPRDCQPDLSLARMRIPVQQCFCGEDHTGSAKSALYSAVFHKCLLERMKLPLTFHLHTFYGQYILSAGLYSQNQA